MSLFPDGTALLPSFSNVGDENTGVFFPAADTLAVSTGGVERYRVNATGLGIGTQTPEGRLNLSGNIPELLIDALGGTTSHLRFRDGTVQSWRISRFDGPDDLRITAESWRLS